MITSLRFCEKTLTHKLFSFRYTVIPKYPSRFFFTFKASKKYGPSRSRTPSSSTTQPDTNKLNSLLKQSQETQFMLDPVKQAELYEELVRRGKLADMIYRFEQQPQLTGVRYIEEPNLKEKDKLTIQQHPACLRLYMETLLKLGDMALFAEKAKPFLGETQAPKLPVGESRLHHVQTDVRQWKQSLGSQFPKSALPYLRQSDDKEPIQVVISEAWSWSKFTRKFGAKFLYAVLLMTGFSVILEQQGIIKSGMSGAEVEPNGSQQQIRFADVEGVDEAKEELEEVVEFLKEPKKFMEVGGKLPKGILLYGPPGTGKTHLARAIAGEAGVPFFQMSGSEFDEMYVGVGARRVRELFAAARKKAPCIVFIDEIDAVGSKRSSKDQSYMRQTLNQLLVELDGQVRVMVFSSSEGVIFIAATNTVEALDKALIRPGRFDRHVPVPLPDVKGRSRILQVHSKGITVNPNVNMDVIARGTPGFSGADLANLINQAALRASKLGAKWVDMQDMEWAKDKIIMGSERKSAVMTEEGKKLTAYHEGGHALMAIYTQGAMPLHKVTVIPRGNALGVTVQLPEGDVNSHSRKEMLAMLDVCMGGRVAEEVIFGREDVTTGASNDLEKATAIAKDMVMRYGMNDKVGPVSHSQEEFEKLSPHTKQLIENEIKLLLETSYNRTALLLKTKRGELERLAQALMEYETLTSEEVNIVVKGGSLNK